jgi:hypothetical protein
VRIKEGMAAAMRPDGFIRRRVRPAAALHLATIVVLELPSSD